MHMCVDDVMLIQKRLIDKKAERATLINKIDVKKNRSFDFLILCRLGV